MTKTSKLRHPPPYLSGHRLAARPEGAILAPLLLTGRGQSFIIIVIACAILEGRCCCIDNLAEQTWEVQMFLAAAVPRSLEFVATNARLYSERLDYHQCRASSEIEPIASEKKSRRHRERSRQSLNGSTWINLGHDSHNFSINPVFAPRKRTKLMTNRFWRRRWIERLNVRDSGARSNNTVTQSSIHERWGEILHS